MDVFFFIYNSIKERRYGMDILSIINSKELADIPILYILRVIHVIQKNEKSCKFCEELSKNYERIKE